MVVSMREQPASLFVRSAMAIATSKSLDEAANYAATRWPDTPAVGLAIKAAVSSHTTSNSSALTAVGTADFIALVRPRTILGRLGRVRKVPFTATAPYATGGAAFGWVSEGAPLVVSALAFDVASLPPAKAGGLVVFVEELARNSSPSAETVVREDLIAGLATFMDVGFIDPTIAAVGDAPASITNGIAATPSTGNVAEDLRNLLADFTTLDGVAVIVSERSAIAIATTMPGVLDNGLLFGFLPLVISSSVGDNLVAVHMPSILLADDGNLEIGSSREATLQMLDNPTNNSATPTATAHVSLWQTNSVAVKLVRYLNWLRKTDDAVAVVSGADYTTLAS